ncbi:hypothetical protein BVC80_8499g11 [Macleaya cordata]|uniref:Transcription factor n=1 Tax=Macleaya cordata TaxID=56857 RepID=A0A200QY56_MACCD|nr:hypothetical protein BVC80_8499g11 [Macleaya cordata]
MSKTVVIVFSPTGKSYSFGHPSVDTVVDRYLSGGNSGSQNIGDIHPHVRARVCDLNRQYTEAVNELEAEKNRGGELEKVRRDSKNQHWGKNLLKNEGCKSWSC